MTPERGVATPRRCGHAGGQTRVTGQTAPFLAVANASAKTSLAAGWAPCGEPQTWCLTAMLPSRWRHCGPPTIPIGARASAARPACSRGFPTRLGGVHDYGEDDGRAFTVMELLTGETLLHRLARVGRIPFAQAAEIAAQVAEGLHAAHQAGVIHRDVKPANIIVTEQGVKLVDFGIALGAGDDRLTATGTLIGSATYLAPERGTGWPATPGSDVYSLGIVLYQMLAGRPPYTGRLRQQRWRRDHLLPGRQRAAVRLVMDDWWTDGPKAGQDEV